MLRTDENGMLHISVDDSAACCGHGAAGERRNRPQRDLQPRKAISRHHRYRTRAREPERAHKAMTSAQFAAFVGLSYRTIQRYLADGRLQPAHRTPGGHARFTADQKELFICRDPRETYPGLKSEAASITSTGTGRPRIPKPRDGRSALAFARETLLRRKLASQPSSPKARAFLRPK